MTAPIPRLASLRFTPPLVAALTTVIVLEMLARLSGIREVQHAAWAAMACVAVFAMPRLGLRESYLMFLCAALTALVVWLAPDPAREIAASLDQAGFLMVFILLIGLLHEAASSSPSVSACGEYLTRQPPGRRYYALNFGTAVLAVLFNIGVVSFLVPLIQRGIERATPGDSLNGIREQRQISALLRGFSWCVIWSPTAIAPLAVAELIPGTNRNLWILYGFGIFLIMLILGALEDKFRFRSYTPATNRQAPPFPAGAYARFAAACCWLFGMTAIFVWSAEETVIFGLLMACPLMLIGWLLVQNGFPQSGIAAGRATAMRLRFIVGHSLPKSAPVAITLACSGFVGRAGAALVPAESLAAVLQLDAVPDFILLSILPGVLALLGLLAVSPIMMAIFFGSLFGALPVPPADPTLIALSISCGWALSMTCSPFATVVLMINRYGGISARRLTFDWNFRFTLMAAAALVPVFWVLTGGR